MEVFNEIAGLKKQLGTHRSNKQSIGLVPTMGYLHEGHAKLLEASIKKTDITVCSIFVNPAQFNNPEDLENYPQNIVQDLKMLEHLGVDYVFCPSGDEMYPLKPVVLFEFENIGNIMEGQWRPGHFSGVGLIVSKLLNIVQPDMAFFGEKDLQQLILMKRMVLDLNMDVNIVGVPTLREESGLALSSRNARLSDEEKKYAATIFKALSMAKAILMHSGDIQNAKEEARKILDGVAEVEPEYIEIVDPESFEKLSAFQSSAAICIAAKVGSVRLIDNIII